MSAKKTGTKKLINRATALVVIYDVEVSRPIIGTSENRRAPRNTEELSRRIESLKYA
jgi:hypothetical protein